MLVLCPLEFFSTNYGKIKVHGRIPPKFTDVHKATGKMCSIKMTIAQICTS